MFVLGHKRNEPALFNYIVGAHEDWRGDCYPDATGNFIVNGHFKSSWLFKRHLCRVAAGKDTHDKVGVSQPQLGNIGAVSDKATIGGHPAPFADRRESSL